MNLHQDDMRVTQWLQDLERALGRLPRKDSREILSEAREHIHECLETGLAPEDILADFGSAQSYARAFLDEHLLTTAQSSGRTMPMLRTVVRFAGRSVGAALGLAGAAIAAFFALWGLFCIVVKIFQPHLVGLWLDLPLSAQHRYVHSQRDFIPLNFGHDHIVFGFQNPPPAFPEYLGIWVYPCLIGITLLSYLALRASLLAAVSRIHLPERLRVGFKLFPAA